MLDMRTAWKCFIVCLAVGLALLYLVGQSLAKDSGQWTNTDPEIASWYRSLMQPDHPLVPCCSFADAYYADKIIVRGNKTFAVITDDRPDEPFGRPHIPVGTEFEIQPNKLKWDSGNPVGHNVLFVGAGGVYCFVQTSGA